MEPALYDTLKDFQPLIATFVAVLAAVIAYGGQTAKVRADKRQEARTIAQEKLSISLQVSSEARIIAKIASHFSQPNTLGLLKDLFADAPSAHSSSTRFMVKTLIDTIKEMRSIDTAWTKIYLFPSVVAEAISDLLSQMKGLPAVVNNENYIGGADDAEMQEIANYFTRMHYTAGVLRDQMKNFSETVRQSLR